MEVTDNKPKQVNIYTKKTSRKPQNMVSAGEHIQNAVKQYVQSFICFLLIFPLFIYFFISNIQALINGHTDRVLNEGGFQLFLIAVLSIVGFVLWVKSLIKLDKAGLLIKTSEAIYYKRSSIKVTPSRTILELNGLKIGQELSGGIIAYFDTTSKYAIIASKSDLTEKMSLQEAKLICEKLDSDKNSDWFLPDIDELLAIYENLHTKGMGNFMKDKYWSTYREVDFASGSIQYNSNPSMNLVRPIRLIELD